MVEELQHRRDQSHGSQKELRRLEENAGRAISQIRNLKGLNPDKLAGLLEDLLVVKQLTLVQSALQQLPPEAFQNQEIISIFLRYLIASGERKQAVLFAQKLKTSNSNRSPRFMTLLDSVLHHPPEQVTLPRPRVVEYEFDIDDSHYSMKLVVECPDCKTHHLEAIGWGVMVLRTSYCPRCLTPVLIDPEFIAHTQDNYHLHDGGEGIREIDKELYHLISEWHLQEGYPQEGYFNGCSLAEPLMLPVLRTMVRDMYKEKHIKDEEAA